jgi:hypothetical protein
VIANRFKHIRFLLNGSLPLSPIFEPFEERYTSIARAQRCHTFRTASAPPLYSLPLFPGCTPGCTLLPRFRPLLCFSFSSSCYVLIQFAYSCSTASQKTVIVSNERGPRSTLQRALLLMHPTEKHWEAALHHEPAKIGAGSYTFFTFPGLGHNFFFSRLGFTNYGSQGLSFILLFDFFF